MQPEYKIVIWEAENFSPTAFSLLSRIGNVVTADRKALRDAEVLWVRLGEKIDAQFLNQAPHLKVIVTATTGLNHIDLEEAERRGIRVLSLRGQTEFLKEVRATAEHTICLTLALLRHLPDATAHVKSGGWDRDIFRGAELNGKTVGIIGYGRLGRIVSRYLIAFGARVVAYDPKASDVEAGVSWMPFSELLRESDIVTLHVNFTEANRRMFGANEFAQMKAGSWFVNTARGELLDEDALLHALETKHLSGAALDVLGDEHTGIANRALVEYARRNHNLIITPHIGGCTTESMEKTEIFLAHKLCECMMETEAVGAGTRK